MWLKFACIFQLSVLSLIHARVTRVPPRDFAQTPCEGNKLPYLTFEQREQSLKENLTLIIILQAQYNEILVRRQRFAQNLFSTHKTICCNDVSMRRIAQLVAQCVQCVLTFRMCHNEIIRILIIVDFVFDDVATYFRDTFFRHQDTFKSKLVEERW